MSTALCFIAYPSLNDDQQRFMYRKSNFGFKYGVIQSRRLDFRYGVPQRAICFSNAEVALCLFRFISYVIQSFKGISLLCIKVVARILDSKAWHELHTCANERCNFNVDDSANLDTEWGERMFLRFSKILYLGHLRNPIKSLLCFILVKFCKTSGKNILEQGEKLRS